MSVKILTVTNGGGVSGACGVPFWGEVGVEGRYSSKSSLESPLSWLWVSRSLALIDKLKPPKHPITHQGGLRRSQARTLAPTHPLSWGLSRSTLGLLGLLGLWGLQWGPNLRSPLACLWEGASRAQTGIKPKALLLSLGLTAEENIKPKQHAHNK